MLRHSWLDLRILEEVVQVQLISMDTVAVVKLHAAGETVEKTIHLKAVSMEFQTANGSTILKNCVTK